MKNKKYSFVIKNLALKFLVSFLVAVLFVFGVLPFVGVNSTFHGELAEAEGFQNETLNNEGSYPYVKTFIISAYYSPLPCQNRYATGSYAGDIRLNGRGVAGASGTPVYPGMIAAPKEYPFGTKMDIPAVGIVSVQDRGGAIKSASENGPAFDRLDIWMGYGDIGLNRALNWGKRTIEVVVYGQNDAIREQIILDGYSPAEAIPNDCNFEDKPAVVSPPEDNSSQPKPVSRPQESLSSVVNGGRFSVDLKLGDSGAEVRKLQDELRRLNFFNVASTGYYGEVTQHAVFKFQQSQRLVGSRTSLGAGILGPKTRDNLNRLIVAREYNSRLVADATHSHRSGVAVAGGNNVAENVISDSFSSNELLSKELDPGQKDGEVAVLQQFLKEKGFFEGMIVTEYFGPITKDALIKFQIANNIISSERDLGAGRVGPSTLALINS
jgi:peptidoglycan hydrolase-like protein with peptidoglycan-binding domain/3D (Asp-Asp-Asp) domain-containing protein